MTPTGSPAWTRTASHLYYGGDPNKRNLLSVGVVDAQTDISAEQFARMVADLEALMNTAPFAVITYQNNDTTPGAPTILSAKLMTGVTATSYSGGSPPAGFPSASRTAPGDVTFTFASSYADAFGVSGPFVPVDSLAQSQVVGTARSNTSVVSGQTVRVRCFLSSGSAASDDIVTLMVW